MYVKVRAVSSLMKSRCASAILRSKMKFDGYRNIVDGKKVNNGKSVTMQERSVNECQIATIHYRRPDFLVKVGICVLCTIRKAAVANDRAHRYKQSC